MDDFAGRIAHDFADLLEAGPTGLYELEWIARGVRPDISNEAARRWGIAALELVRAETPLRFETATWPSDRGEVLAGDDLQEEWLRAPEPPLGTYVVAALSPASRAAAR